MKMSVGCFMSSSRVANEEQHHNENSNYKTSNTTNDDSFCSTTCLTVWTKSLVMSCSGFAVFDCQGNLVYRVDNYCQNPDEILLMDGSGKSILAMHRHKKLTLVDKWLVYEGEAGSSSSRTQSMKGALWYVKKNVNIWQTKSDVLACIYKGTSSEKKCAYTIEGSYLNRSCKVLDGSKRVVAEIKRKEAGIGGVSFGAEVFWLVVHPGLSPDFAMALVLLLDQMFS